MNADEIVKGLQVEMLCKNCPHNKLHESECLTKGCYFVNAVTLIESLQAQLAETRLERNTQEANKNYYKTRLAAYEDTGLTPEQLQELAKARNLIGKTVYCAFAGVKKIMRSKIHGFEANSDRTVLLAENGKKDYYLADISAVGKTIFLTREAAEKAIAEVVGDK